VTGVWRFFPAAVLQNSFNNFSGASKEINAGAPLVFASVREGPRPVPLEGLVCIGNKKPKQCLTASCVDCKLTAPIYDRAVGS
jgi:hypothetical protein